MNNFINKTDDSMKLTLINITSVYISFIKKLFSKHIWRISKSYNCSLRFVSENLYDEHTIGHTRVHLEIFRSVAQLLSRTWEVETPKITMYMRTISMFNTPVTFATGLTFVYHTTEWVYKLHSCAMVAWFLWQKCLVRNVQNIYIYFAHSSTKQILLERFSNLSFQFNVTSTTLYSDSFASLLLIFFRTINVYVVTFKYPCFLSMQSISTC